MSLGWDIRLTLALESLQIGQSRWQYPTQLTSLKNDLQVQIMTH